MDTKEISGMSQAERHVKNADGCLRGIAPKDSDDSLFRADVFSAISEYEKTAESHNGNKNDHWGLVAMMKLAQLYETGFHPENGPELESSTSLAEHWYQKAVETGCVEACRKLAELYYDRGLKDSALEMYSKAVAAGDDFSKFKIELLQAQNGNTNGSSDESRLSGMTESDITLAIMNEVAEAKNSVGRRIDSDSSEIGKIRSQVKFIFVWTILNIIADVVLAVWMLPDLMQLVKLLK